MKKANGWKVAVACSAIAIALTGTALADGYGKDIKEKAPIVAPAPDNIAKAGKGDSSLANSEASQAQLFDIRGTVTDLHRKAVVAGKVGASSKAGVSSEAGASSKAGASSNAASDPNQAASHTNNAQTKQPANTGPVSGFFVQGDPDAQMPYDQANVRLTDETKIYKKQGNKLVAASLANIAAGTIVEVHFEGPVAESYPVQATAGKIVIVE